MLSGTSMTNFDSSTASYTQINIQLKTPQLEVGNPGQKTLT